MDGYVQSLFSTVGPAIRFDIHTGLEERKDTVIDTIIELFSTVWSDMSQSVVSHKLEADQC